MSIVRDTLQKVPIIALLAYLCFKYYTLIVGVLVATFIYILTKKLVVIFTQDIDKRQVPLLLLLEFHNTVDALLHMLGCSTNKSFHRVFFTIMHLFPPSRKVDHTRLDVDGLDLNIYKPHIQTSKGVIVYYHGGWWILLSARAFHCTVSYIAEYCKITVVSVDYRKAPENPFPAGLIDCYNTLLWVQRNSEQLGVDNTKVLVMGDSAGGNLSAAVSLLHRDMKGVGLNGTGDVLPPLAGQILIYPTLQGYDFQKGSMKRNSECGLSRGSTVHGISLYLAGDTSLEYKIGKPSRLPPFPIDFTTPSLVKNGDVSAIFNPYIFPLMPCNLSNLPPAYILIAKYDVLRDDGENYANSLENSGNKVVLCEEKRAIHGFMMHYHRQKLAKDNLMKISDFINTIMDI